MPIEAQTRFLRAARRSTTVSQFRHSGDVRIVAATHRDLRQLIRQGMFREDLFYRLNVVPIRLPPLRERKEDIPDLVRHFLTLAQAEGLPEKSIDGAAMQRLTAYRWPGNIRELENLVKRLVALYAEEVIGVAAIDDELRDNPAGADEDQTTGAKIFPALSKGICVPILLRMAIIYLRLACMTESCGRSSAR